MGMGLEVVTGFVTAPGATLTAWTLASGNSLQIRNAPFGKRIYLLDMWAQNQVVGVLRLRSPRIHDNVQGLRFQITATDVHRLFRQGMLQPLIPQDVFVAEQSGSGVAGQIETGAFLVWYEELPGVNARLIDFPTLMKRLVNDFTVEVAITPGVAGGYSGAKAINSSFDLFKANTDYALLGYVVTAQAAVVRFTGIDTGNLGVGGPGFTTDRWVTAEWFARLSEKCGLPLIPVFNSANKFGINVDVAQNQAGGAVTVNAVMAELAPGT